MNKIKCTYKKDCLHQEKEDTKEACVNCIHNKLSKSEERVNHPEDFKGGY